MTPTNEKTPEGVSSLNNLKLSHDSSIPQLPESSIHPPTSKNPSPSKGLKKLMTNNNTRDETRDIKLADASFKAGYNAALNELDKRAPKNDTTPFGPGDYLEGSKSGHNICNSIWRSLIKEMRK